jgi:hypothetical protein
LRKSWRADPVRQDVKWWRNVYFKKVRESDFLTGQKTSFVASFPWLVKPQTVQKVMNGMYVSNGKRTKGTIEDIARRAEEMAFYAFGEEEETDG